MLYPKCRINTQFPMCVSAFIRSPYFCSPSLWQWSRRIQTIVQQPHEWRTSYFLVIILDAAVITEIVFTNICMHCFSFPVAMVTWWLTVQKCSEFCFYPIRSIFHFGTSHRLFSSWRLFFSFARFFLILLLQCLCICLYKRCAIRFII